ncbi:DUF929 family protein [Jatrophihabitans endophyticus]|uniref:DUF929 family protein n=1 Tax=Jatrophihabitans endophyticus TaxID=1206085 RepID=UPI0019F09ED0|nr:DUF929 family protein [Jatrophihabitans endophyticus]MBE7190135.1 DUF929 family protein [Jatrophihabitans endophyticus]
MTQTRRAGPVAITLVALATLLSACSSGAVVSGRPSAATGHPAPTTNPTATSPTASPPTSTPSITISPLQQAFTFAPPPASVLDTVGAGSAARVTKRVTGPALTTSAGRPRVLFVGAEYCPYCAAQRWALATALSRFGTLHSLTAIRSSPSDVDPNTATFSFHGASFTGSAVGFTGVELYGTRHSSSGYAPLDHLDAADGKVFRRLDRESALPFVDIGGRWAVNGSPFDPQVLQGATQAQIDAALAKASSPIARAVDGAANVMTAAICTTTSESPAAVCRSRGVRRAAAVLPAH